jgi:hypothetical protein
MPCSPQRVDAGLVEIVRDFLVAHRLLRGVAARLRNGELGFPDVQGLVGDDDGAVLYRLKERCHALFRGRGGGIGAEELFDLAVGSLFHEAMKFRECFYQRDAYGPKVRALRIASVPDAAGLLPEFERILEAASVRLEEALHEAERLLMQTSGQFRILLRAHVHNGLVTRFLVEHRALVEEAFGSPLDEVLADLHGTPGRAWARAARSYLHSGFFAEAAHALSEAERRGEGGADTAHLRAYAEGMQAYLEGRYGDAVERLTAWADTGAREGEEGLARLARAALSRVGQLVDPEREGGTAARAAALAERLGVHGDAQLAAHRPAAGAVQASRHGPGR